MPRIWADVYDAAGTLLGPGPLTNIKSARITRALDGTGEISLDVPLADERVQDLITNERRVKLWTGDPGLLVGENIPSVPSDLSTFDWNESHTPQHAVDSDLATFWQPDDSNPDDWDLGAGPDLDTSITVHGYRLTFPTGGDPDDSPKSWTVTLWTRAGGEEVIDTRTNQATWAAEEVRDFMLSAAITLTAGGDGDPADNVWFNFHTQQGTGHKPAIAEFAWLIAAADIPTLTPRLVGMGILRKITGSNAGALQTLSGPDQLDELRRVNTLLARTYDGVLCADVVEALIALVSGWSAVTTNTPANYLYARFDGSSVLKGLQEIAKQQGLHFRWASDKAITFGPLGDAAPLRILQAGHQLMRGLELNDDVALIDALNWQDDSEAVANWIIPVGGGQGEAALTLQHSTRGQDRTDWLTGYAESYRDSFQTLKGPGVQNGQKLAMKFTLAAAGFVKSALLQLRKFGNPTDDETITIETDSGNAPSGTLADANLTMIINEADFSAVAWVMEEAAFATGAVLAAGTYWLVQATARSQSATNYVRWGTDRSSPGYAGGLVKRWNGAAWEEPTNARDAIFAVRTLVESRITDVIAEYDETHQDRLVALQRLGGSFFETSYSGGATSASSALPAYPVANIIDGAAVSQWGSTGGSATEWVEIMLATGKTIRHYRLVAGAAYGNMPTQWVLAGSNGGAYTQLDVQTGITWSSYGETKEFSIASPASYSFYRLTMYDNGAPNNYYYLAELDLLESQTKEYLAQSFKGDGGRLAAVKLLLSKHGTPTDDLDLKIEGDSGGSPDGTPLEDGMSELVFTSNLGITPARHSFTFNTPPVLVDDTTYWIVLETTGSASETDFVLWSADGSSPSFADGEMKSYNGAAWVAESKDAIFKVEAYCVVEPYAIQTTTGPDGRTLYYLSDADSISTYGQIEKVFTSNITPLSMSAGDLENAANALYDAAAAWLQRYAYQQSSYSVALKKAYANILPGQVIRLTYKGFVYDQDGNKVTWRDVDEDFWITRVTEDLGSGTTSLELSNLDRAREDISALIVGAMEAVSLRNVQVQPYPAIWSFFSQDSIGSVGTFSRGEGYGDTVYGKTAQFVVPIPTLIMNISKAVLRLQTRPLPLNVLADNVASTNANFVYFFAPLEDSHYPADLSLAIDGVDVSAALGGPWLDNNEDEALDIELDITAYLSDEGLPRYGSHLIEVTCDARTTDGGDDHAVPGYAPLTTISTHGVVQANVSVHCVTQAVKT